MLCVSLLKDKTRCPNNKIDNSYHCDLHREKAKSLYLKYKQLQKQCEELDLNNNNIEYIERCYILFNRAYKAREKHRAYAFNEKYWDEGHNYQFTKLISQMQQCEVILESLYKIKIKIKVEENIIINHDGMPATETAKCDNKLIAHWKEYRENLRKVSDDYIEKCIKENEQYREEHEKLIYYVERNLLDLFYDEKNDTIYFHEIFALKNLLDKNFKKKLSDIKFIPKMQQYCRSAFEGYNQITGERIIFDDKIKFTLTIIICKFIEELIKRDFFENGEKFTCKLILKMDESYISNLNNDILKIIFKTIIYHKIEIKYLISSIILSILDCYSNRGNFLFLEGYLLMDKESNEFMFVTENTNEKYRLRLGKEFWHYLEQ